MSHKQQFDVGVLGPWGRLAILLVFVCQYLPYGQSLDTLSVNPKPNQSDLISNQRVIRPAIYFNHYNTPESRRMNKTKKYSYAQNNIGFFFPVFSNTWFNKDSVSMPSIHILLGGDFVSYKPDVTFLNESFRIARFSFGGRMFYSDGKKSILYIGINPFSSRDIRSNRAHLTSFTGAIIYSRTVNNNFAYRLGLTNSYTFGVMLPFPVLGLRVGALDQLHLNVQFPKNISLEIPMGKKTMLSVFSKSMGGLYNISQKDSLINNTNYSRRRLARYELMQGAQLNVRPGSHLSFYIGTGFSTRRRVNFSYRDADTKKWEYSRNRISPSLFFSFGMSLRLGKAKQVYNNSQMYNLFELNTINAVGQKETGTNDNDIPAHSNKYNIDKMNNLKYKDVEDLITDEY